jgi:hypothetical protein
MALLPALYCLALGATVWLAIDPWQVLRWDNLVHNLPLTHEAYRQLASGRLPAWNPSIWSGSPLLADPQAQAFYPIAWLAYAVAADVPATALHVLYALHVGIGAGGTYVLARALDATRAGGLLAATVFTLNPFAAYLATSFANELAVLAWLPWCALAALRAAGAQRPLGWLALGGVLAALAWSAGYPQLWVYSAATTVVLTAGCATRFRRGVACGVVVPLLGLALSMHQILPFLDLWRGSQRASIQSLAEFLRSDVPLASWPAILLPGLFGSVQPSFPLAENNWPHLGLCAVVLALIALAGRPRRVRLTLLVIGGMALWLASGASGGLLPLVYESVPGIGFLRGPYKFYACTTFAVALLAGLGLSDVQHRARRWHAALVGLGIALAVLAWVERPDVLPIIAERAGDLPLLAMVLGTLGGIVFAIVVLLAARTPSTTARAATAVGATAIVATLAGFAPELGVYTRPSQARDGLAETERVLATVRPHLAPDARWYWGVDLLGRPVQPDLRRVLGALHGLEMATGYSAFLETGYARAIAQDASTVPLGTPGVGLPSERGNRVLDVLATRHVLLRADEPAIERLLRPREPLGLPTYGAVAPLGNLSLLVRESALPRVRAVPAVAAVASRDAAIHALQSGRVDPAQVALVEAPEAAPPQIAGSCNVGPAAHEPGRVAVDATCNGPGFLVFGERHDAGWRASVDGAEAPLVRAYGLVLGLPVGAGEHRIELRYEPPGFRAGAVASLLVLALLVAGAVVSARRV